jgi:hypothetical protein
MSLWWSRLRAWLRKTTELYTMKTYRKALAMNDETREDPRDEAPPTTPAPSVGRTVYYTTPDGLTWPAMVSEVDLMQPMVVGLTVFGMQGPSIADVVSYDPQGVPGTWRWPEAVLRRVS